MKRRTILSRKILPFRLPVTAAIAHYLLLAHFDAPVWVFAIWGTLMGILMLTALYIRFTDEEVDPFGMSVPDAEEPAKPPTRWAKRMAEIQAEQAARKAK